MKARWWKWVVGLLVVGGVVLAIGVMRLIERPAPMSLAEVEAQQIAFFESLAPTGEAATTKLLEAWERMDAISAGWPGEASGRWSNLIWAMLDDREMLPEQRPGAAALFATLGPGVDLVMEASSAPRLVEAVRIDDAGGVAIWSADDGTAMGDHLRAGSRALLVSMRAAADRGEPARFVACVRALLRFSRLRSQSPDMLGVMMGWSHIDGAINETLRAAQQGQLSSEACRAIADLLVDDSLWRWMLSYEHMEAVRLNEHWEEASRRDELRQTLTLDLVDLRLRGAFENELSRGDETDLAWLDWTCARSPDEAMRLINEYGAQLAEWYAQPFETRSAPAPFIAGHPFEASQRYVAQDVRARTDLLQSKLTGAALALRLIALRQDGGELPSSLAELNWPEVVCPLTGRLFEYQRWTPDAGDPRAFIVRAPVTQAELSRVAPRMGRDLEHWVLVTRAPVWTPPPDRRSGSYEWLSEGEKLEEE